MHDPKDAPLGLNNHVSPGITGQTSSAHAATPCHPCRRPMEVVYVPTSPIDAPDPAVSSFARDSVDAYIREKGWPTW